MIKKYLGRKQTLVVIVVAFFVVGLAGSIWYRSLRSQGNGIGLPSDKTKQATLRLSSNKNSVRTNDEFTVTISLDSGDMGVDAADFVVDFNPQYVKVESVTTGDFFQTYPINRTETDSIRISGVAFFDGKNIVIPKGTGTVGKINFIALDQKGDSRIEFDRNKTIVATGGENILDSDKIHDFELRIQ